MDKAILQFEDVVFSYPASSPKQREAIIDHLSFSIKNGEFVSILGPSGSGKSTIFRLITGLENPLNGAIYLNEKKDDNRLGKVGYMPQKDLLLEWRTILENVILPLEVQGIRRKEANKKAEHFLEKFGLLTHKDSYPYELSGGMRQRASFLRAMLSGSSLLLLDEPFSALDAMTRLTMQQWLLTQWEQLQHTVLFITHDIDEALLLSDRLFLFPTNPLSNFDEIVIPLKRPRTVEQLLLPEIVAIKKQLLDTLYKRVNN